MKKYHQYQARANRSLSRATGGGNMLFISGQVAIIAVMLASDIAKPTDRNLRAIFTRGLV
jgi:enamine deaminase RidA (YjgF/YER057c/UK114 family)